MAIVATLLDKAKQGKSLTSDSALAAALGTNRQVVSQWRAGDSYPSEDNIAALALMGGDDPTQWLVAIKAVRSEGSAGKYWAALAKRLAATAMTLALGVSFALPARAQDAVAAFKASSDYTLCEIGDAGGASTGAPDLAVDQVMFAQTLPSRNGTRSMSDSYKHGTAAAVLGCWPTLPKSLRPGPRKARRCHGLRDAARNRNLARKARQQSMVKVVFVDLASWRQRHFGSITGPRPAA